MKTVFKMQGTLVSLKSLNCPVAVYPGMLVLLHQKYYTVQQAILDLEQEELTVLVVRRAAEPV